MPDEKMPHAGHDKHLCYLASTGHLKEDREDFKKLVRNGKYVCKGCGRVAAEAASLCAPEEL